MSSKRKREPNSLGDVLKEFISKGNLEKGINKISAEEAWHHVMGSAISNYTQNVLLQRDILYVSLSSSVLREELSYGKEKIINLLNEELGEPLIQKLILR